MLMGFGAIGAIGTIDTLASAMQQQEGYFPGSLAYTNNNPGNLVPAGQPGCTPGAGGFCQFPTYDVGYQALVNQINLDASRGYTVLQFTTKYLGGDPNNPGVAPGGDPVAYANAIANATGTTPDTLLIDAASGGSGGAFGGADVLTAGVGDGSLNSLAIPMLLGAAVLMYVMAR
jgi:hypothetical protein